MAILVSRLREGGPTRDLVCHLLGQAGPEAVKVLTRSFDQEGPRLQEQILQILGQYTETDAIAVLRKALLSEDRSLSCTAAGFLAQRLPELSEARRRGFREHLHKGGGERQDRRAGTPATLAAGDFGADGPWTAGANRSLLLKFAGPKNAHSWCARRR